MQKLFFCWFLICTMGVQAQVHLVPQPAHIALHQGHFIVDRQTGLQFNAADKELAALAAYFAGHIHAISGLQLPLNGKAQKKISIVLDKSSKLGAEGYQLQVTPTAINIKASAKGGAFYAVQSLIQTLPPVRTNEMLKVPCMQVQDEPRFAWRGLMLDVSRHFYSVEAIKEVIDLMALYKMNRLHWHLTDNEGWRLEIKKYPKLTSVGAWRQEWPGAVFYKKGPVTPTGPAYTYGGYYTQEEAKAVVAYAAARNITVVPEIEMPGHSGAALAAYPQFSCFGQAQAVPNTSFWNGQTDSLHMAVNYCAGNDSAFLFLQNILDEVMAIFPSPYVHVGGDEVDKSYWKRCPRCQRRMQQEGLQNEEALQSYFVRRMEKYLLAHNKKLVGWDEILEGGLAPSATVMSWRGERGGIAAAKQHHPVIMSPSDPLYFNRYQAGPEGEPLAAKYSINTLERVYRYDPQPAVLSSTEKGYILGGQAAVWTEFISSPGHLQYMLLPRLPALAEVLWSPADKKDFNQFVARLNGWHFGAWQHWGLRFHAAHFSGQTHEGNRR